MKLTRRAKVGNVYLDEVHPAIVITGMDPGTSTESYTTQDRMLGWGRRITSSRWQPLEATVSFAIDIPKKKLAARREVFDAAVAWAQGGTWLTFNSQPARRLSFDKVDMPAAGDLFDWTNEYTFTFHAETVPFWQNQAAVTVVKNSIRKGSITIDVGGTAPSVLDLTFENISGQTIANVIINVGNNPAAALTGVNMAASETLSFKHNRQDILSITSGSRNVYGLLTGADDLYTNPGKVTVAIDASRTGKLTVTNYARWL